MKKFLILLTSLLLLAVASAQEIETTTENNALLERALTAMAYAPSFKQGVALQKQQSGRTNPFIEAVLSTDDVQLNEIFATVYAKYLSPQQIEELVRFYESPTGQVLIAQQAQDANNANPALTLNAEQTREASAFSTSTTIKAFAQIAADQQI